MTVIIIYSMEFKSKSVRFALVSLKLRFPGTPRQCVTQYARDQSLFPWDQKIAGRSSLASGYTASLSPFMAFASEGMSGQQSSDNVETLFSLELLVECVRIAGECGKVSDELAVGVRLLDFPTLLIYQPQQSRDAMNPRGDSRPAEYAFNRGKSCFFQMNLNSLHGQLLNSPLYAMVLDVKEEIPRLVGTSLISLAKVMARVWLDVTEHGVSTSSSHGERRLVALCNLKGEEIGSISLSYKLLSVGASFLPHITDYSGGDKTSNVLGKQGESITEENISKDLLPLECGDVRSSTPGMSDSKLNEAKQDRVPAVQNVHEPENEIPQTQKETENSFEDDLTVFCPPHLFYNNSSETKGKNEQEDCRNLNLDSLSFPYEDSEEETSYSKVEEPSSLIMSQKLRHDAETARTQHKSGTTLNNLGEALQQLPLLNALLVELAHLNDQSPKQPLSVHPNLAWIYRPASAQPPDEHVNTVQKVQTKPLQKTRQWASPHVKNLHIPKKHAAPAKSESARVKGKQALTDGNGSRTSPRKKLVYGTTRTFNLRVKLNSRPGIERRECLELIKSETKSSIAKEKPVSLNKTKSNKGNSALNQSAGLNENIETIMQSMKINSGLQETVAQNQKNLDEKIGKQDRSSLESKDGPSLSERGLNVIHLPSIGVDGGAESRNRHQSESDQSQTGSDRHGGKTESSGSSRRSSPKPSSSYSSGEENQEVAYADDFNSLEPSDGYSPDPASSPESSRAKTPKSPLRHSLCISDSGSEAFQSRAVLPVPVKAPASPQRALMGTHIIRPRAHNATLSFSSDDGDRDRSASSQTVRSGKQSGRSRRSPGDDSFISSEGRNSESSKNCKPVRGFSGDSVSSFEPQEAEELGDELGSLDFRMQYQPISNLVASKLPGYTL